MSWTSPTSLWSSDWETHSVALTAANFTGGNASFASVMSDVTALWVRGELITYGEEEGLDNVRLAAITPEPSTFLSWSLLGGFAFGIGFWRRKRGVGWHASSSGDRVRAHRWWAPPLVSFTFVGLTELTPIVPPN